MEWLSVKKSLVGAFKDLTFLAACDTVVRALLGGASLTSAPRSLRYISAVADGFKPRYLFVARLLFAYFPAFGVGTCSLMQVSTNDDPALKPQVAV